MKEDNINSSEIENNEDTNVVENDIVSNPQNRNLKPFVGVVIALIIIISVYYFIWKSIAAQGKIVVSDALKAYKYEDIIISGFPFSKVVTIKNIIFDNNTPVINKNFVEVEEIKVSSFILGEDFKVNFKDITLNESEDKKYRIIYNEDPEISISFYPEGFLKKIDYKDSGYRVLDDSNTTLYTAGNSLLILDAIKTEDNVDYALNATFQNMQNLNIIENAGKIGGENVPEIFTLNIDISSSINMNQDNSIQGFIVKINDFNLIGNMGNNFKLTGEVIKDASGIFPYGDLTFILANYEDILNSYKNNIIVNINAEMPMQSPEFNAQMDKFFGLLERIIKQSSLTTNDVGYVKISKQKDTPDYVVNGQSLYGIIQDVYSK